MIVCCISKLSISFVFTTLIYFGNKQRKTVNNSFSIYILLGNMRGYCNKYYWCAVCVNVICKNISVWNIAFTSSQYLSPIWQMMWDSVIKIFLNKLTTIYRIMYDNNNRFSRLYCTKAQSHVKAFSLYDRKIIDVFSTV